MATPLGVFTEALPIPPVLKIPANMTDVTIALRATAGNQAWGYIPLVEGWPLKDATSPGPTIEVEKNQPIRIHWKNELPAQHLYKSPQLTEVRGVQVGETVIMDGPKSCDPMPMLSPDPTTNLEGDASGNPIGATVGNPLPDVRNVTHIHGAMVSEPDPLNRIFNNDGWPDAWNVPGEEQITELTNPQDARALWYHDHAFGQTGRNVAAGLEGLYLIRDDFERSLNLPSGAYEIPLLLQGVGINSDGSKFYTDIVSNEFYGNVAAVNGKVAPYLEVEPRKYRFRITDGSNARMFGLKFQDQQDPKAPVPSMHQIGTDAGFMADSLELVASNDVMQPQLYLNSAERADVIVDFSQFAGRNLVLNNVNAITDPDGEIAVPKIMLFKVGTALKGPDTSSIPKHIREIQKLDPAAAVKTRQIVLGQTDFPSGLSLFQINKRSWVYQRRDADGKQYWDYEIDQKPKAGTTEIWEIVNTTTIPHPFHIHLVQFQVLDRRTLDLTQFAKDGQVVYTDVASPADPTENGWKDVATAPPGQVTRLIMNFGPFPGYYVYHCHILEHEDMDMMVPFEVVP